MGVMRGHVFISYSTKDVAVANQVVSYLESRGYPCWIAPRNISSGGDYTDMINDAIRDCRALVLIMSSRSVQSQWVKKELATAVSFNRTIIPFRISSVQLTGGLQFLLNNVQWIDATIGPVATHFPQIIKGIEREVVPASVIAEPPRDNWLLPGLIGAGVLVVVVVLALVVWHPWQRTQDEPLESELQEALFDDSYSEPLVVTDTVLVEVPVETPAKKSTREEKTVTPKVYVPDPPGLPDDFDDDEEEEVVVVKEPEPKPVVQPVTQPVAQPVTQPAAQPQVQTQTTAKRTPSAEEQAAERYNRQFKKAKKFYDVGNYKDALTIFNSLKREKPSDTKLDPYIKECHKQLGM